MFDVYIKDFNQNGTLVSTRTLVQSVPSLTEGDLKLISPIVKVEMGNAESLDFSIESGTRFYDSFLQMKTFIQIVYDGDTIFYGRVLTISNDFFGNRKIRCEGPLAFFNDTAIEGTKEESRPTITVHNYLSKLIENHNNMCADDNRKFKLGEVPGQYTSASSEQQIPNASRKFGQDGWTDTKGAIEDLRSHYGGYLRIRYESDGLYLDWMNHYFYKYNEDDNPQTIEVGKNILDISTSTEIDNIFTVVIPIGNNKTTSTETADGEKKSTGPKHFYAEGKEVTVPSICSVPAFSGRLNSGYHTSDDYAQAINKYGRIIKTVTFDDAENSSDLLNKCYEWILNNYQGEVTKFSVKALDMHQIRESNQRKIMVGDQVKIIYPVFKEDGSKVNSSVIYTCLSISYDLYNPENNSYTFGIPANILTKSYGVTKQGKSTQQASTTPKSSGGGGGSTKEIDWLDQVTAWLSEHKICYKHDPTMNADRTRLVISDSSINHNIPYPWNSDRRNFERGPYTTDHLNYFYDTEVSGLAGELTSSFTLWNCVPIGNGSRFNQEEYNAIATDIRKASVGMTEAAIAYAIRYAQKQYTDTHASMQNYECYRVRLKGTLSHQAIVQCHIIDYVKQEYGHDLTKFGNVSMPEITYTEEDGTEVTVAAEDGYVVTKEMFNPNYKLGDDDEEHKFHIVMTDDGRRVGSCLDDEGNWTYYEVQSDGTVIESHIRNLSLVPVSNANFVGSMVTQGTTLNPLYLNENGEPHEYRMGQGIEKWRDGEIVTATVDGDVVRIGSKITQYATTVATRINGSFISPMEYIVDPDTGKQSAILVGKAGQASYEAYYDKKAETYLPVPYDYYNKKPGETAAQFEARKAQWLADNGPLTTLSGDGVWDTDNLAIKGGVYTVMESGKPVTYVASKQLIMGNKNTTDTVRKVLCNAGLFQTTYVDPADGKTKIKTITDPSKINWDDYESTEAGEGAIVTPVLMAQNIYANRITANEGRINTIFNDYLKSDWISSHVVNVGAITAKSITGSSTYNPDTGSTTNSFCTFHTFTSTGNKYYIQLPAGQSGSSVTNRNLADGIYALKIFGPDATTKQYTLKAYDYTDNPAADSTGTDQSNGTVVGTFRSYTGGWDAACSYLAWPSIVTDNSQVTSLPFKYPNTLTVDGAQQTRTYTLANDGNNVVTLYYTEVSQSGSPSTYTVGRIKHNKYNSGWDYCAGSATDHPCITVSAPPSKTLTSEENVSVSVKVTKSDGNEHYVLAASYTAPKVTTGKTLSYIGNGDINGDSIGVYSGHYACNMTLTAYFSDGTNSVYDVSGGVIVDKIVEYGKKLGTTTCSHKSVSGNKFYCQKSTNTSNGKTTCTFSCTQYGDFQNVDDKSEYILYI